MTIPSQRRFVGYFAQLMARSNPLPKITIVVQTIELKEFTSENNSNFRVEIFSEKEMICKEKLNRVSGLHFALTFSQQLEVSGDFRVEVHRVDSLSPVCDSTFFAGICTHILYRKKFFTFGCTLLS